jgi:hypothetical protein
MKGYIIFALVLLAASMGAQRAYSQTQDLDKDPWVCPTILVDCPEAGGPVVRFTAKVTRGVPADAKSTFNWTVSGGKITGGHGTPSINVDASGFGGQSLTATIEVGGIDRACSDKASCSVKVCDLVKAMKFDEYGDDSVRLPASSGRKRHRRHPRHR